MAASSTLERMVLASLLTLTMSCDGLLDLDGFVDVNAGPGNGAGCPVGTDSEFVFVAFANGQNTQSTGTCSKATDTGEYPFHLVVDTYDTVEGECLASARFGSEEEILVGTSVMVGHSALVAGSFAAPMTLAVQCGTGTPFELPHTGKDDVPSLFLARFDADAASGEICTRWATEIPTDAVTRKPIIHRARFASDGLSILVAGELNGAGIAVKDRVLPAGAGGFMARLDLCGEPQALVGLGAAGGTGLEIDDPVSVNDVDDAAGTLVATGALGTKDHVPGACYDDGGAGKVDRLGFVMRTDTELACSKMVLFGAGNGENNQAGYGIDGCFLTGSAGDGEWSVGPDESPPVIAGSGQTAFVRHNCGHATEVAGCDCAPDGTKWTWRWGDSGAGDDSSGDVWGTRVADIEGGVIATSMYSGLKGSLKLKCDVASCPDAFVAATTGQLPPSGLVALRINDDGSEAWSGVLGATIDAAQPDGASLGNLGFPINNLAVSAQDEIYIVADLSGETSQRNIFTGKAACSGLDNRNDTGVHVLKLNAAAAADQQADCVWYRRVGVH